MLTLGRLAALAASVERATRQDERARQLNERIELTREIHERVMQRLFGLDARARLRPAADRRRAPDLPRPSSRRCSPTCARRSAGRSPRHGRPPRDDAGGARRPPRRAHARARRQLARARSRSRRASSRSRQSVFLEALRNCEKHARARADRGPGRGARATRSSSRSPTTASPRGRAPAPASACAC